MKREVTEISSASAVDSLAELFPGAVETRLPVKVISFRTGGAEVTESTVIEYGTGQEALFHSSLSLELGERVKLENVDGTFDVKATVVAAHFENDRKAIAVRFAEPVRNWIIR